MSVQIIESGPRNLIVKLDSVGGDTGTAFLGSTLLPPFTRVNINRIWASLPAACEVELIWEATANVKAFTVNETMADLDFTFFGGITNNALAAGKTGSLLYSGTAGLDWTIILHLIKH